MLLTHFNFWFAVAPLCFLAAIAYGWKSATGKTEERFLTVKIGDGLLGFISAIAIGALLFLESFNGIIALLGATADMAHEDPEYGISAIVAVLFAAIVFGVGVAYVAAVIRLFRSRYLLHRNRLRLKAPKKLRKRIFLEKLRRFVHKQQKARQERKEKRFVLQEDLDRAAKLTQNLRPGSTVILEIELYSQAELRRMKWRRNRKKA